MCMGIEYGLCGSSIIDTMSFSMILYMKKSIYNTLKAL